MLVGKFTVDRVSSHKSPMVKTIDGEEMMVDVGIQEVVLVPADGDHGSMTLRFFKLADCQEIANVAEPGGTVTLSIEKTEDAPAAPTA